MLHCKGSSLNEYPWGVVPGNERRNLLRVVMGERGRYFVPIASGAVMADGGLQEVFVMKDENYENSEQLNNESLSMDSGVCGFADRQSRRSANKYCGHWECVVICFQE